MGDLVVATFPTEAKAEVVGKRLLDLQREYMIEIGDAIVATKPLNGPVKCNSLLRSAATAATNPVSWGALVGMIILMPWAGLSLGAVAGTLGGAFTEMGIDDGFIRQATQRLQSGNAALILLIRKMTNDRVIKALQGVGGRVLRTSFDQTRARALHEALAASAAINPTA
jgi:uncharacterized membrane protein